VLFVTLFLRRRSHTRFEVPPTPPGSRPSRNVIVDVAVVNIVSHTVVAPGLPSLSPSDRLVSRADRNVVAFASHYVGPSVGDRRRVTFFEPRDRQPFSVVRVLVSVTAADVRVLTATALRGLARPPPISRYTRPDDTATADCHDERRHVRSEFANPDLLGDRRDRHDRCGHPRQRVRVHRFHVAVAKPSAHVSDGRFAVVT